MEISVEGIEATQATQFYRAERHLDAATAEPDNAIPLVAGKPLALRVYPDVNRLASGKETVTVDGELWFRSGQSIDWQSAVRFPEFVLGRRSAEIDRGDAQQTLNFRIPERFSRETLHVRTRVWGNLPGSSKCYSDWCDRSFSFVATRPLRLRLYGVHYRGKGLDLAPPTAADALDTLNYLRKTYPVARVDVASYEVIDFAGDLTDRSDPSGARGWGELLLLLSRLRAASVTADPHYALLPRGVPNDGCAGVGTSFGVGASYVGVGNAMAQEVGHIFCRQHAPGCGASDTDPEYPAYGTYDSGSIGEYGFDPIKGQVYSPQTSHDFMSYCGNYWVSPHTYRALLDIFTRPTASHEVRPVPDEALHLHLSFSLDDEHRVDLENGLTLPGRTVECRGEKTSHRLELRDGQDRLLACSDVRLRDGQRDRGEARHFLESIPFHSDSRRLAVVCCPRHDPVVYEIPDQEMKIAFVGPLPGKPGSYWDGVVRLQWEFTCPKVDNIAFFLRYSRDGGRNWQPVNISFEWRCCHVDLDRLPGGADCRFQIIASTLLQTATAESVPFQVRRKPLQATIAGSNLEQCRQTLQLARTAELTGAAHSPEGFAAEGDLTWLSDIQGSLGHGTRLEAHDLTAGEHQIALVAPDGLGGQTRDTVMVRVSSTSNGNLTKEHR